MMKRKYMTAYFKPFNFTNKRLSRSTYLIRINATYSKSSVLHPLVIFAIILVVYL